MSQGIHRKIRPDAVWAEVRKAWEDGETARSVAARYDVGVHALWKRREAEGWKRPEPTLGPIEPAEGWDRHIQARRDAFNAQLEDARALAECLAAAMTDERLMQAPHWHIPWLYHWRATHLGPEATARDRARAIETGQPWAERFWDADGTLKPLAWLDLEMARLHPEDWRAAIGLPDGLPEAAIRYAP
ncbi:hypothetical protein SH203_00815 [Brevundimonas sp. SH203]|uniref:hypothetical protein n=1 Tax=Brevundimonas sp. SH203 TaxID=345167 RepID=UPI0009CA5F65|nr:hypothetical protein [Brevundimonas sp. SH203]GAW40417.1 hypothetical protein SH203_00815 [Brevundimonas sp. SH203]